MVLDLGRTEYQEVNGEVYEMNDINVNSQVLFSQSQILKKFQNLKKISVAFRIKIVLQL